MTIHAQIIGQWLDVNTYALVNNTGHKTAEKDGGLFTLQTFTTNSDLNDVNENDLHHVFIPFEELVNQGYAIGDTLTIQGEFEVSFLMTLRDYEANRKQLHAATKSLVTFAEHWAKRQAPKFRWPALQEQNRDLLAGEITTATWLSNQRAILFQEREPSRRFLKYEDDLAPRIYQLRTLVANAAIYALISTEVASISTHRPTATDKPLAPEDVPIYREAIQAGVPMRENYKQEWEKYRKEAAAYRQAH